MTSPRQKSAAMLPASDPSNAVTEPPAPRVPAALARLTDPADARKGVHKFDKAFPVFLTSTRGLANGVGRNISRDGMFIETRDPCPIGSEVRITFSSPELATEFTAVAEVRFQAFLNFATDGGDQEGLRGIGVRFKSFEDAERPGRPVAQ